MHQAITCEVQKLEESCIVPAYRRSSQRPSAQLPAPSQYVPLSMPSMCMSRKEHHLAPAYFREAEYKPICVDDCKS